jgi:hypothetical protein
MGEFTMADRNVETLIPEEDRRHLGLGSDNAAGTQPRHALARRQIINRYRLTHARK